MSLFSPKFRRLINCPKNQETETPDSDQAANDTMHQSGMNHAKVNEHDLFGGHFDQGLHRQISMEAKSKKIRDRDEFAGEIDRGENTSIYATCHTIDDCMWGLHTCLESSDQVKVLGRKKICDSDYDWILDGDDSKKQ
mmetsp:Transcript_17675/g.34292  ORF Transcript_17675/g.34292 Transcript_17675/m.34292 type:complete len:138 (+) Transcript_17675:168-581(+)